MSLSAFQALIAELGHSIGVGGLAPGDDGYVGLQIDDHELHVQYEADDDRVVLFARLQEIDPARRDAIFAMLLAANYFWEGTNGATFSADFDTGRVFLADRRDRAALDVASLSTWIEQFADSAAHWRERIDAGNDGGPLRLDASGDDVAPAGGFNGMPPGSILG